MKKRNLILIQLNEINFDLVQQYVARSPGFYKGFEALFKAGVKVSSSENDYDNLEPWIQWPSVHTGLSYAEHGIFRLGDVLHSKHPQFFEELEARGFRVGAISPMNAENRLKNPAYFIPDPWTATPSDGSFWSRHIGEAVSQLVNDNSKAKISLKSAIYLSLGILRFFRWQSVALYWSLLCGAKSGKWRKALFLDVFLNDLHLQLLKLRKPNFSTLFLNAGAHIQHHYLLNSKCLNRSDANKNPQWYVKADQDPFEEMVRVYDAILQSHLELADFEVIVATGLSQLPYEQVKYYYRLKDHTQFLNLMGLKYKSVAPRMTRDFLIEFDSVEDVAKAESQLSALQEKQSGISLFKEIDNRGLSLFVTLTWPVEVQANSVVEFENGASCRLEDALVFVAVKNGMHSSRGYVCGTEGTKAFLPEQDENVKGIYHSILNFFHNS